MPFLPPNQQRQSTEGKRLTSSLLMAGATAIGIHDSFFTEEPWARWYSIVQGSAIGPAAYVVNTADLTTVGLTSGSLLRKYADDTYIIVPAVNRRCSHKTLSLLMLRIGQQVW